MVNSKICRLLSFFFFLLLLLLSLFLGYIWCLSSLYFFNLAHFVSSSPSILVLLSSPILHRIFDRHYFETINTVKWNDINIEVIHQSKNNNNYLIYFIFLIDFSLYKRVCLDSRVRSSCFISEHSIINIVSTCRWWEKEEKMIE